MPLRRLLHRFQLICTGSFEPIQEMQGFRFEMQVRTSRPAACVPTETNDLAAAVGASRSTNAQMAVSGLDASPSEMKRPAQGGTPTTPADPIVGSTYRTSDAAGDVQAWMILFDAMGHHTRHRQKQRREQTEQRIRMRIGRES